MSKRFVDTQKYHNPWYRKLPIEYKGFWGYLCTQCDLAGVWRVDLDGAEFSLGVKLSLETALELFGDRVHIFDGGEKWWLTGFVSFQQGPIKKDTRCGPHLKIIDMLEKYGLWEKFSDPKKTLKTPSKECVSSSNSNSNSKKEEMGKHDREIRYIIDEWHKIHTDWPKPKKSKAVTSPWVKINARLCDGRTVEEIIKGIKGNAADEWHKSVNKHELSYICQSCDRLDRMISKHALAERPTTDAWRKAFNLTISNYADLIPELEKRFGPLSSVNDKVTADKWIAAAKDLA